MPERLLLETLPFHIQDDRISCGAAAAQIVIGAFGVPITQQPSLMQSFQHGQTHPDANWYTHPEGLASKLQTTLAQPLANAGLALRLSTQTVLRTALGALIDALRSTHQPTIVASGRDSHWVVVHGFEIDRGFVNFLSALDPAGVGGVQPRAHVDNSTCCDPNGSPRPAVRYAYADIADFLNRVRIGFWNTKRLRVETVRAARSRAKQSPKPRAPLDVAKAPWPLLSGTNVAEAQKCIEAFVASIADPDAGDPWSGLLKGATVGTPQWLAAARPGVPGRYWAPVTPRTSRRPNGPLPLAETTRCAVTLAADASGASIRLWPKDLTEPHNVLKATTYSAFDPRASGGGAYRVVQLEGPIVWQPCRESPSPLLPFRRGTLNRRRVFVRLDGVMFRTLTTDRLGA